MVEDAPGEPAEEAAPPPPPTGVPDKSSTEFWGGLLGHLADAQAVEELIEAGRGKRSRKNVNYNLDHVDDMSEGANRGTSS